MKRLLLILVLLTVSCSGTKKIQVSENIYEEKEKKETIVVEQKDSIKTEITLNEIKQEQLEITEEITEYDSLQRITKKINRTISKAKENNSSIITHKEENNVTTVADTTIINEVRNTSIYVKEKPQSNGFKWGYILGVLSIIFLIVIIYRYFHR